MGWSGFTGVGYPKIMPVLLADHVERNKLQGKLRFNLFVGASTGAETEDRRVIVNHQFFVHFILYLYLFVFYLSIIFIYSLFVFEKVGYIGYD